MFEQSVRLDQNDAAQFRTSAHLDLLGDLPKVISLPMSKCAVGENHLRGLQKASRCPYDEDVTIVDACPLEGDMRVDADGRHKSVDTWL
jgi:hypothetical protein